MYLGACVLNSLLLVYELGRVAYELVLSENTEFQGNWSFKKLATITQNIHCSCWLDSVLSLHLSLQNDQIWLTSCSPLWHYRKGSIKLRLGAIRALWLCTHRFRIKEGNIRTSHILSFSVMVMDVDGKSFCCDGSCV